MLLSPGTRTHLMRQSRDAYYRTALDVVAECQRRVDRAREEVRVQAFLDIGIDKKEARVLARIGLTILVGTQQIEEKVDRKRLNTLLSEYQQWLGSHREDAGSALG